MVANPETWLALAVFIFAGFITPGPNTMMVFASGAAFGYRRTIPHMAGVMSGTILLFLAVGGGLHTLLALYPTLQLALKVTGLVYLLYLAFRIALKNPLHPGEAKRPVGFLEAVLIQFLNVKLMGIAAGVAVSFVLVASPFWNVIAIALVAGMLNIHCTTIWTLFGALLKRAPLTTKIQRFVNWAIFALMLATLIPIAATIWNDLAEL